MFINSELIVCPGYGWQGGPEFDTRIATTKSGVERRNANNIECRHSYILPVANISSIEYLVKLKQAFMACRGQLHSFKIKDWSDHSANREAFGIGDGTRTVFPLRKDSIFGVAVYTRFIEKPNNDVVIRINGSITSAYTLDHLTGLVTFNTAPADDAVIDWTGTFCVPVRFNSDILSNSIDNLLGEGIFAMNGSITLIEVFKE